MEKEQVNQANLKLNRKFVQAAHRPSFTGTNEANIHLNARFNEDEQKINPAPPYMAGQNIPPLSLQNEDEP